MDPIGLHAGDANVYRYCGNDGVLHYDPSGTQQKICKPVEQGGCGGSSQELRPDNKRSKGKGYVESLSALIVSPYWGRDENGQFHWGVSIGVGFGFYHYDTPYRPSSYRISGSVEGAGGFGSAVSCSADGVSASHNGGFGMNAGLNFDLSDIVADWIDVYLYSTKNY